MENPGLTTIKDVIRMNIKMSVCNCIIMVAYSQFRNHFEDFLRKHNKTIQHKISKNDQRDDYR